MNRENFSPSARRRAFTLIELVVVVGILSLLLVVTVPRVGALYDRQLVEQQVRLLEKDLIWLRAEAQRSGEKASFARCEGGYRLTVRDANGEQMQTKALVSERLRLQANSLTGQIVFEPRGTAYDKCTLTVRCGEQARTIVVSNLGRIRVGVAS